MLSDAMMKVATGVVKTFDLSDDLVAHYLLNNNSDDSAGVYDGVDVNVTYSGDTAEFNGTSAYMRPPLTQNIKSPITVSLWIKVNTLSQYGAVFNGLASPSDKSNFIRSDTDALYFGVSDGSNMKSIDLPPLTVDVLTHLVFMSDGSTLYAYIDSVLQGSISIIGSVDSIPYYHLGTGNINHTFGGQDYNAVWIDGIESNIRIYSDAKSQQFISALYAEGYYPKPLPLPTTTGLIAHYPLTGTAEDTTGNYDGIEQDLTFSDDSEFGAVSYFNATSTQIICLDTNYDVRTNFSLSFWYNVQNFNVNSSIFSKVLNPNNKNLYLKLTTGGYMQIIRVEGGNSTVTEDVSAVTSAGEWYHGVISIAADGSFVYYLDTVSSLVGGVKTQDNDVTDIFLGKQGGTDTSSNRYRGWLRGVKMYNRGLTQQEVEDIYNYEKNFRHVDIDDGLIAYYPLANNSLDNYYNQYDGTDTSMTYGGLSGTLNGTSSSVLVSSFPAANTMTSISLTAWIKTNTTAVGNFLNLDGNNGLRARFTSTGYIEVINDGLYNSVITLNTYNDDVFHHVAVVCDSSGLYIYVNNVLDNSNALAISTAAATTNEFTIGAFNSGEYYSGLASKVRIYDKSITKEQVKAIYDQEKGDFI